MSFEHPIDNPWLFVLGISVIPLFCSYTTTVLVRWLATQEEFIIDASKRSFSVAILGLYVIIACLEGVVFEITGGIPPGSGLWQTLLFLIVLSIFPITIGISLFTVYLLTSIECGQTEHNVTRFSSAISQDGLPSVLLGGNVLFVASFVISSPSFFVFIIIL
jgi:hypothetical protein